MTPRRKWTCYLLALSLFPLLAGTCATNFRDAVIGGALDYVSGTVTDVLTNALPVAEQVAVE